MKEIPPITVQVKLSDGNEDQYVLVHDGQQVVELAAPGTGKVGTHPTNKMLVGTKEEIEAEIVRLNLKPKKPRRPADRMPPARTPTEDHGAADVEKETL
jgi:hypothetical protein